jgi:hypothetical protein
MKNLNVFSDIEPKREWPAIWSWISRIYWYFNKWHWQAVILFLIHSPTLKVHDVLGAATLRDQLQYPVLHNRYTVDRTLYEMRCSQGGDNSLHSLIACDVCSWTECKKLRSNLLPPSANVRWEKGQKFPPNLWYLLTLNQIMHITDIRFTTIL